MFGPQGSSASLRTISVWVLAASLSVSLAGCASNTKNTVLTAFFDGVPRQAAEEPDAASEPRDTSPAGPSATLEGAAEPGLAFGVDSIELIADPRLASLAAMLAETGPAPETPAPLEEVGSWQEALDILPVAPDGAIDWARAAREGVASPRLHLDPGNLPRPPYSLGTLSGAAWDPSAPALDLDIHIEPERYPFFDVVFPHDTHSFWLNCTSCHPDAAQRVRGPMKDILAGQYCGTCHGRVAYEPEISCGRCHPDLRFPDRETIDAAFDRARREPMAVAPELLRRGEELYGQLCTMCHGDAGAGAGEFAEHLDPKPRDFTSGKYKFRTTLSASLPTDEDIFRTVTAGVPGTSMPGWSVLSDEDRWALVHYVKSFSDKFEKDAPGEPIELPPMPEVTDEMRALGLEYFAGAGCNSCHGDTGAGDGASAPNLKDDWGNVLPPANFASGRPLKGGSEPIDIYRAVMTGLQGTPMPGFGDFLKPEETWAIVAHVMELWNKASEPHAVRGDIRFERAADASAEFETEPATFPHWFHRARFRCSVCHTDIFEMEAGANDINMDALRAGEFCAKCHNGTVAFEVGFATCTRCHAEE